MAKRLRVALIVETSSAYGRDLLAGVARYTQTHDSWSIFLEQRSLTSSLPAWLRGWDGDGIISRSTDQALVQDVATTGIPLVDVTDRLAPFPGVPRVMSDNAAIGRVAAEHLLERGFRQLAFCGFTGEMWSEQRFDGLSSRAAEAEIPLQRYDSVWFGSQARDWDQEAEQLCGWVRSLPTPVGVLACNDLRAQQVLDACRRVGRSIPEEVAVMGVDNDDLLCRLSHPALTSVVPNARQVGFRAAELLGRLMEGEQPEPAAVLVPPLGIAVRQSTDIVAIDDPEVAAALTFIRENACRGITVEDVIAHVSISRSSLERRLRKHLQRSPQQEIRFAQIKRARSLLAETDLPIERIASLCGFEHPEYMHVVFKRELQMTPGEYRRSAQP